MSTDTWVTLAGIGYALIVAATAWTFTRTYRNHNGYDMDTEHLSIALVAALLWPLTLTGIIITTLILAALRRK